MAHSTPGPGQSQRDDVAKATSRVPGSREPCPDPSFIQTFPHLVSRYDDTNDNSTASQLLSTTPRLPVS
jgi:hypothetical protein